MNLFTQHRRRLMTIIALGFGLIATSLFVVENEVQSLREDLKEIHRQIHADREAIHVMQAEWAYLTQPQRIAALSKTYLPDFGPQQSSQYYSEEAITAALNRIAQEVPEQRAETSVHAPEVH